MDPQAQAALGAITEIFLKAGAVAVLVWIVNLMVSGKLHSDSEVEGLRRDKADLLVTNKSLSDALKETNELLRIAIERGGGRRS